MGILDKWTTRQASALKDITGRTANGLTPSSSTTDPSLKEANRNYLVFIKQNMDKATVPGIGNNAMVVMGQIAQDFQIDQEVKWATPWGAGLAGDGSVSDVLAVSTGNRLVAQVATLQVWQGAGNDISFTVSFELRAWSSTARDVMIPLQYLLAMSMPSRDSAGFLISPGPILKDGAAAEIGRILAKTTVSAVSETGGGLADLAKIGFGALTGKTTTDAANESVEVFKKRTDNIKSAVGNVARKESLDALFSNKISINIGQWFSLDNVVVTNVQHTLKSQMPGPDGGLMAADVTVSFRPMFALTTEDIPSILRVRGSSVTAGAPLKIG